MLMKGPQRWPLHHHPRPPLSPPTRQTEPRLGGRRSLPRRALCPLSSGKNLLSTAHTRRWSGRPGALAPTRRKPAGTSMGSLEMETRRRSFPAWQKPRRNGRGSRTLPRAFQNQVLTDKGKRTVWTPPDQPHLCMGPTVKFILPDTTTSMGINNARPRVGVAVSVPT